VLYKYLIDIIVSAYEVHLVQVCHLQAKCCVRCAAGPAGDKQLDLVTSTFTLTASSASVSLIAVN